MPGVSGNRNKDAPSQLLSVYESANQEKFLMHSVLVMLMFGILRSLLDLHRIKDN